MLQIINGGIFDVIRWTVLCCTIWPFICSLICMNENVTRIYYTKVVHIFLSVWLGMFVMKLYSMMYLYVSTN